MIPITSTTLPMSNQFGNLDNINLDYLLSIYRGLSEQYKELVENNERIKELYEQLDLWVKNPQNATIVKAVTDKLNKWIADGTLAEVIGDFILTKDSTTDIYLPLNTFYLLGNGSTQGMCAVGNKLWITNRATTQDTEIMNITVYDPSNFNTPIETFPTTTGHYNDLCYFNGYVYGTGQTTDYKKVTKINATTKALSTVTFPYGVWGMFFTKPSDTAGAMLYLHRNRIPTFEVMQEYQKERGKFYPLTRVDYELEGLDIAQGAFCNTFDFVLHVMTSNSPYGKNYLLLTDYSGRKICKIYLQGTENYEIEDVAIIGNKLYVNAVRQGKIYVLEFNCPDFTKYNMYTSVNTHNIFKSGTIKNVYANGYTVDTMVNYNGKKLQDVITVCDSYYLDEFQDYNYVFNINGSFVKGVLNYAKDRLTIHNTVLAYGTGHCTVEGYWTRKTSSDGLNYIYEFNNFTCRYYKNDGTVQTFGGSGHDNAVQAWKNAVDAGVMGTIYPLSMTYTVGNWYNYNPLSV